MLTGEDDWNISKCQRSKLKFAKEERDFWKLSRQITIDIRISQERKDDLSADYR